MIRVLMRHVRKCLPTYGYARRDAHCDAHCDAHRRASSGYRSAICAVLVLGTACGTDVATNPTSKSFPRQLLLNHHAITLATVAPYDTIRLMATVLDQTGTPFPTTARAVYTTSDTSVVVDSTGLMRVHWSGSDALNITVVARLSTTGPQAATFVDTAIVNVVNWNTAGAVPTFDSLVFRPVSGDSARRALYDTVGAVGEFFITPQALESPVATTSAGVALDRVVVHYQSSDSLIASFVSPFADATAAPQVRANSPGVVLLTAEATAYGRHRVDSLVYVVGYPLRALCVYGITARGTAFGPTTTGVPKGNFLSLDSLVVSQGGAVLWENSLAGLPDDSLDIHFDDSTHVAGVARPMSFPPIISFINGVTVPPGPGGNIPPFPAAVPTFTGSGEDAFFRIQNDASTSKARVFSRPGIYHWISRRQGISGTVTVIPNDSLRRK